jgi:hypothetical protein
MRNLLTLNDYRLMNQAVLDRYGNWGDGYCGVFIVPSPVPGRQLKVVASSGDGWDHVSVSICGSLHTPTWGEMDVIKRVFFDDDTVVMQLHVPTEENISYHPGTLHLWAPLEAEIPRPPAWMVGPTA